MREEFVSELVEANSNWPEVVAIAEGESDTFGVHPLFEHMPQR